MAATEQLFNVRERKRFERHDIWERIAENGTISAAVMVFAAIAAVICANTDAYEAIHHFLETPLYVGLGNLTAGLTVELFVNDFLMAIFFLLVGIELKYEMTVGELKNPRQAMLPMLAAVGGVLIALAVGKLNPFIGFIAGIKAFTAAVLGGIGSIPGAMLGGVILGVAETFAAAYISSEYKDIVAFGLLVLILLFRPTGLLGKPEVEKV